MLRMAPISVFFCLDVYTLTNLNVSKRGEDVRVVLTDSAFAAIPQANAETLDQCSICLSPQETGEEFRQLPKCKHSFHVECLRQWLTQYKRSCLNCRVEVEGETRPITSTQQINNMGTSTQSSRNDQFSEWILQRLLDSISTEARGLGLGLPVPRHLRPVVVDFASLYPSLEM
jgi:hypothetical protein